MMQISMCVLIGKLVINRWILVPDKPIGPYGEFVQNGNLTSLIMETDNPIQFHHYLSNLTLVKSAFVIG